MGRLEVVPLLTEFRELRTQFKVGCRGADSLAKLIFSGAIPVEFCHMFTELPQTPFGHMSSTQVRGT